MSGPTRFAAVTAALLPACAATCPTTPDGDCVASVVSVEAEPVSECDPEPFADGCAMSGDLSEMFDPAGFGGDAGVMFHHANDPYGIRLHVDDPALVRAGAIAHVFPATSVRVTHSPLMCFDSCSVYGREGTVPVEGTIASCADTGDVDCLSGTLTVDFVDVVFDDGATLDASGWTATYG